jgi:hypothetical protein
MRLGPGGAGAGERRDSAGIADATRRTGVLRKSSPASPGAAAVLLHERGALALLARPG